MKTTCRKSWPSNILQGQVGSSYYKDLISLISHLFIKISSSNLFMAIITCLYKISALFLKKKIAIIGNCLKNIKTF